jgi:uncharacterized Zn-binding protein involved in type VI secretion
VGPGLVGLVGQLAGPPKKQAARVGDQVEHPAPEVLTAEGSPNVFIGGQPAWRGIGGAQGAQYQQNATNASNMVKDLQTAHDNFGQPDQMTLDNIKQKQLTAMTAQINNLPAGVDIHFCDVVEPPPIPHGPGVITDGSKTVTINGMTACRMGDTVTEAIGGPNKVVKGCLTVFIGD